jgi:predicted lipoprotein with Yx(FWY)xxD motif
MVRTTKTRRRVWLTAVLAGVGLLAAACTSAGPPPESSPTLPGPLSGSLSGKATTIKTEQSRFGPVLADGTGYTLYWFDKDTATKTACLGVCVSQWPPVTGVPKLAPGLSLPGTLSSFIRSDDIRQVTYNGHPLYTYAGDPEPGEIGGNDLYEFSGYWYAMTVTAATPSALAS